MPGATTHARRLPPAHGDRPVPLHRLSACAPLGLPCLRAAAARPQAQVLDVKQTAKRAAAANSVRASVRSKGVLASSGSTMRLAGGLSGRIAGGLSGRAVEGGAPRPGLENVDDEFLANLRGSAK